MVLRFQCITVQNLINFNMGCFEIGDVEAWDTITQEDKL